MEMTGLLPQTDSILEIALVITDTQFVFVEQYSCVVHQPQDVLLNMNDWCKEHHAKSGLTKKVIEEGIPLLNAEKELYKLFTKYKNLQKEPCILAGNSIMQDRLFLEKHLSSLTPLLHYRMLDVSSFKIVYENLLNVEKYPKKKGHRAEDDILESIEELKYYLTLCAKK
jgi:oligoribonuclease